ncbi:hypothetical protein KAU43_05865 [candidate division WOR-3 bacterium]|nr:hypothetical protein [candidate division WOR-3 bacterium]
MKLEIEIEGLPKGTKLSDVAKEKLELFVEGLVLDGDIEIPAIDGLDIELNTEEV